MFPKCFIILFYVNCQLSLVSGHCGDCWKCFCPIWRVGWSDQVRAGVLYYKVLLSRPDRQLSHRSNWVPYQYYTPSPPCSQFTLILSLSRNWKMFRNSCLGKDHKAIVYGVPGKELIFSRRVLILMSQVSSSKTSFSRSRQPHQPRPRPAQRQNLEIPC